MSLAAADWVSAQAVVEPLSNTPVPAKAQAPNPASDPATLARLDKQLSDADETVVLKALDEITAILDQYGKDTFHETFLVSGIRLMLRHRDSSWKVRRACAEVLGKIEDPFDISLLYNILSISKETSVKDEAREDAFLTLEAAINTLARMGKVTDENLIQSLIYAVHRGGYHVPMPPNGWPKWGPDMPTLQIDYYIPSAMAPSDAARILGNKRASKAFTSLLRLLVNSQDPKDREAAAGALPKIGTPALMAFGALKEAQRKGVKAAGPALAELHALLNKNLPSMIEDLSQPDNAQAFRILVRIGRPVLPGLLTELAKPGLTDKERGTIVRIFREIIDLPSYGLALKENPVQDTLNIVISYSVSHQEGGSGDLYRLNFKVFLHSLNLPENSKDGDILKALLKGYGLAGDSEVARALWPILLSVESRQDAPVFLYGDNVVRNAIVALGITEDPVSLALLKSLSNEFAYAAVKETIDQILSAAANSKIDIESEKAISRLVSMVFDKTEPYRRQALSALVAMKSPAALAAVIGALGENDNPEVMRWLGELDPKAQAAAKATLEARNKLGVSEALTAQRTERPAWVYWLGGILALTSAFFIWVGNPHFLALRSGHRLFQRPSPRKQIPSIRIFSPNATTVKVASVKDAVAELDVDGVSREWDLASLENSDPITVDRSELRNSDSPIRRAANGTRRAQILLIAAMMGLSSLFLNSAEAPNSPAPVAATKVLQGQKAERSVQDQLKQLSKDFFHASQLSRAGDVAAGTKKELDTLTSLRNMFKNHDLGAINHPVWAEDTLSQLIEHCLIRASDSTGVLKDATLVTLLEIIQEIGPTETFRPAYGSGESFLLSEFGHGIFGSGPEIQRRAIKTIGELNNPYAMIVLESIYISQSAIIPKNDSAAEQRIEGMLQTLSAMVEINNTVRPKSEATERVSLLIPALRNITPKATRRTAILDEANAPDLSNRWRGLPHIVKLIKAPDAAELLRAIGLKEGRPAIPALIEALKAKDPELRDAAAATLETFLATMGEKDPDTPSVKMALKEFKMRPAAPSNFMPPQIKALIMPFLLGLVAFGAIIGGIAAWLSRRGRTTKQAVPNDNPSIDRSAHRAPKDTEGSGTKRSEIRLSDQQLTPPAPTKRNPSLEKTSIAAKLRTAILITFGIVSLYLPGRVYASIAPGLFPGHYPATSVVSPKLNQYPTYQKIITNPAAANTPRMVFDVRKDFPTLASVWPLIELARSQPGARIHLVIISDKAANPFADDLRKAGAGDVLDNNLFVRSYPSLSAVMIGFNRACDQMGSGDPAAVVFSGDLEGAMRFRLNQPPFPRLPVRPPALPTAFTQKAIS
jgi:HEAT repeat protein